MSIRDWLFGGGISGTQRLNTGKFGQHRYQPPGEWVQTTLVEKVVGLNHRLDNLLTFCTVVQHAERNGNPYGVELRPEPLNPYDQNAIAVDGVYAGKRWHLGYLDRSLASELHEDLISAGVPISAELYSIWLGDDGYADVNVIILAPAGHGHKARIKRREN